MPAQILPLLDLSEQAQKEQQNALQSQRLQMQQEHQSQYAQLQQMKFEADQAMAPVRAQLLQQELMNSQLAGQSAFEALSRARENAPLEAESKRLDISGKKQTQDLLAKNYALDVQRSQREENNAILDSLIKNQTLKFGERQQNQQAFDAVAKQASLAATLSELDPEMRQVIAPTLVGTLPNEVLERLLKQGPKKTQEQRDFEDLAQHLSTTDIARLKVAQQRLHIPDDRGLTEKLPMSEGKPNPSYRPAPAEEAAREYQQIMERFFNSKLNNGANPKDLPSVKGQLDRNRLVSGEIYRIPTNKPGEYLIRQFSGFGEDDVPIFVKP